MTVTQDFAAKAALKSQRQSAGLKASYASKVQRKADAQAVQEELRARAGRPAGSYGACHLAAVRTLKERGPMTLRELIAAAGLTLQTAKDALRAAIESGEVQVCGQKKHPNGRRWVRIYEWVDNTDALFTPNAAHEAAQWAADLHGVFGAWGSSK